jgi:hypothetical protein
MYEKYANWTDDDLRREATAHGFNVTGYTGYGHRPQLMAMCSQGEFQSQERYASSPMPMQQPSGRASDALKVANEPAPERGRIDTTAEMIAKHYGIDVSRAAAIIRFAKERGETVDDVLAQFPDLTGENVPAAVENPTPYGTGLTKADMNHALALQERTGKPWTDCVRYVMDYREVSKYALGAFSPYVDKSRPYESGNFYDVSSGVDDPVSQGSGSAKTRHHRAAERLQAVEKFCRERGVPVDYACEVISLVENGGLTTTAAVDKITRRAEVMGFFSGR